MLTPLLRLFVVLVVLLALALPLSAETVRVTAFGDSIMCGLSMLDDPTVPWWCLSADYRGYRLPGDGGGMQLAFNARGIAVEVRQRTLGGELLVWAPITQTRARGIDEQGVEHVNYVINPFDELLASDPDAVFFMLGANDTFSYAANGNEWGKPFREFFADQLDSMLDRLAGYANGRGRAPAVFVSNIVPLRVPPTPGTWWGYEWTQEQIDARQAAADQVAAMNDVIRARVEQHNFVLVDINGLVTSAGEDWEKYYSDMIHPNLTAAS
jgi:lysophospholipase L1-like esterase